MRLPPTTYMSLLCLDLKLGRILLNDGPFFALNFEILIGLLLLLVALKVSLRVHVPSLSESTIEVFGSYVVHIQMTLD